MKEDPPAGVKCKDKFLVQSATISSDKETLTLQDIVSTPILLETLGLVEIDAPLTLASGPSFPQWSAIEKEGRGSIHEQKIRCAYLEANTDGERHAITDEDMDKSTLIDGSVSRKFAFPSRGLTFAFRADAFPSLCSCPLSPSL